MGALKSFAIYPKKHASGNIGYRVDLGLINGKRKFKSFSTQSEAEKFQRKCLKLEAAKKPSVLADIENFTRHEVLAALSRLKEYRATITEAVDFFIKHARPAKADADIQCIMDLFEKVKTKAGRTAKYLNTARDSFFKPFRDHFKNCLVTEVTSENCEKYIYDHKSWNATSRATHIRHLTALFNFAIERGYASLNPFDKVEHPKKPLSKAGDKVATVESVTNVLQYALDNDYKSECAALTLIFFCGVRGENEVAKLRWEQIKLEEDPPTVTIDDTKSGKRRTNEIPPNAAEWLKLVQSEGKITLPNYKDRIRYLRKVTKSGFKQNTARISFASYHVAMHKSGAETAFMLGHSNPSLLWNTYRAHVSHSDAKRYWQIIPNQITDAEKKKKATEDERKANKIKSAKERLLKKRRSSSRPSA